MEIECRLRLCYGHHVPENVILETKPVQLMFHCDTVYNVQSLEVDQSVL